MKYYVFDDEVYIKAEELIDFASKENNNKIEIRGRVYASPVCCKDCKYWMPTAVESLKDGSYINQPNSCMINCWGSRGEWRTANDFCSKGERK